MEPDNKVKKRICYSKNPSNRISLTVNLIQEMTKN